MRQPVGSCMRLGDSHRVWFYTNGTCVHQSSAIAASLAIDEQSTPQKLDYQLLRQLLWAEDQVLVRRKVSAKK